jgi:hypothetical protein
MEKVITLPFRLAQPVPRWQIRGTLLDGGYQVIIRGKLDYGP